MLWPQKSRSTQPDKILLCTISIEDFIGIYIHPFFMEISILGCSLKAQKA
jgi:hypothetical protein